MGKTEKVRIKKVIRYGTSSLTFYLSGKITGLPENEARCNFDDSHIKLFLSHHYCHGDKIIDPMKLIPFLGIKAWVFYMITDIAALIKSDAVVFQPNWINSKGAKIEMWFAIFFGKVIILQ